MVEPNLHNVIAKDFDTLADWIAGNSAAAGMAFPADVPPNVISSRSSFTSFDADGFTINRDEVGQTEGVIYLCLKGGEYHVYDELTNTDTIPETGFGFKPAGGFVFSHADTESSQDSTISGHEFSVGSFSSASQRSAAGHLSGYSGGGPKSGTFFYSDQVYANLVDNTGASIEGKMDIQSMDADGLTFIMDDADPNQAAFAVVAFGPVESGNKGKVFFW